MSIDIQSNILKNILLFCFLLNFFVLSAQEHFRGLIGYSYLQVSGEQDPVTIKKPLYIIYNSNYCKLSIGGDITTFNTCQYSLSLEKGDIVEDFLNDEAKTISRGWYAIRIEHNKNGASTLTINMPSYPNGNAYIVDNAKVYSENGKVTGKVHVENWKELIEQNKVDDSLAILKKRQKRLQDSLSIVDKLNSGENDYDFTRLHPSEFKMFQKDIFKNVDTKNFKSGNIRVSLDEKGHIVSFEQDGKGNFPEAVLSAINTYLKSSNYPLTPFKYQGKSYPAFFRASFEVNTTE